MAGEALTDRGPAMPVPAVRSGSFRIQRAVGRAILYVVAIGAAFIFMVPFAWTIFSSLKTSGELFLYPPTWFPADPQPQNYATVFELVPFGLWTWNTLIISLISTFGAVLSAAIVAYAFARFRFPGRDMLFMITLSTMMLPVEVTLIPLYLLFSKIGWLDSFKPLLVPSFFGGGAFLIFLEVAGQVDSMEHRQNILMAASVMMTAPIILLFFVAQRYFVRGIVMSGIKG